MSVTLSGHSIVDAIANLNFQGNIVPHSWYEFIKRITKRGAQTDHLACLVLADLVYWYRPMEIRDEESGHIIGYRKKFAEDKLQRNPDAFAQLLGCSGRVIREALALLKSLNLIDIELRAIRTRHGTIPNTMFIGINAERVAEITKAVTKKAETLAKSFLPNSVTRDDELGNKGRRNQSQGMTKSVSPHDEISNSSIYKITHKTIQENSDQSASLLEPEKTSISEPGIEGNPDPDQEQIHSPPQTQLSESISLSSQSDPGEDKPSAALVKTQRKKKGIDFDKFQSVYNALKPAMFSGIQTLNVSRQKTIERWVGDFGSQEAALSALADALSFATTDSWYLHKNLTFENFASNNKIAQLSEKWLNRDNPQSLSWMTGGSFDADFIRDRAEILQNGNPQGSSFMNKYAGMQIEDIMAEVVKRYTDKPHEVEIDWAAYCLKNQRYVGNLETRVLSGVQIDPREQQKALPKINASKKGFTNPGYSLSGSEQPALPQAQTINALPFSQNVPDVIDLTEAINLIRQPWQELGLSWQDERLTDWLNKAQAIEPFETSDTHLGFYSLPEWVVCKLAQDLPRLELDRRISSNQRVLVTAANSEDSDDVWDEEEADDF